MSLKKLGNFFCTPENNTSSGISGNGITEPIGLDSNLYPEYNETCLFSSVYSCQTGKLSDSFAKYQRLRLRVGWHNNSTTTNEGDSYLEVTPSPIAGSNVAAIWNVGTGTPGYICVGRINFPTLSSFNGTYGKLCDLTSNKGNTGWEGKLRPIKEIWGINKLRPYRLFAIPTECGTLTSTPISGYAGDIAKITVIPNSDEWKVSALKISGAELTGNDFMFDNSNVTASAGFEHSKILIIEPTIGGVITANLNSGFSGDVVTLIVESTDEGYKFSSFKLTGSETTGNDIMFTDSDITAQGNFEHYKSLTLENGDHGILSADKMSGFSGDVVTVNATTDEGWYLSGIALTGAEATGLKFMFTGSDVTALGEYTDVGFPVTYLTDEHVHLTGDQIYIPGTEGITLDSGYDTYYRISGYDITNGSIVDGKLVPTGPCTIKAVEKVNYFSASGEFEKGSNITWQFTGSNGKSTTIPAKYALCTYMTDNVPAEWYADNNRWKVNDASAYSITLHPVMHFSGYGYQQGSTAVYARYTGYSLVGDDISAQANASYTQANTWDFNKTYTSDTQDVYYRLSGLLWANGSNNRGWYGTAKYLTAGSTGTWTATGIAP